MHWKLMAYRPDLEAAIRGDSDDTAQLSAIASLGVLMAGTDDAKAMSLLLRVYDDESDGVTRNTSYDALHWIDRGLDRSAQPGNPSDAGIDEALVEQWRLVVSNDAQ
jgi:hypothetical protein